MSGIEPQISIGEDAPQVAAPLSPTQKIILDANRIEYGIDAGGRKLGVCRISASLRRRVLKALSPEGGAKPSYFAMAVTAACCVSIDGEPVAFPQKEIQVDALIDRLDNDGLAEVSNVLVRCFPAAEEDPDAIKN